MGGFSRISIRNYRAIRELDLDLGPITCLFGPNGAGKTTLLDAVEFIRDFVSTNAPSAYLLHGGAQSFRPNAVEGLPVTFVALGTKSLEYSVGVDGISAMTGKAPTEILRVAGTGNSSLDSEGVRFIRTQDVLHSATKTEEGGRAARPVKLVNPESSAWPTYLQQPWEDLVGEGENPFLFHETYRRIRQIRCFRCRTLGLQQLRREGSTSAPGTTISSNGENLWSCLRNLRDANQTRQFFEKIMATIRRAFPAFIEYEFRQVGPTTVACFVSEAGLKDPYQVLFAPDGLIQFTLDVAALYCDGPGEFVVLLDEPDLSLHPWALFVFAEAIQDATKNWNRQVLLATHSPVLLSQLPEDSLYLMMPKDGQTTVQRLSDMEEPRDLLNQYSAGTLYMTQLLGAQSEEPMVTLEPINE